MLTDVPLVEKILKDSGLVARIEKSPVIYTFSPRWEGAHVFGIVADFRPSSKDWIERTLKELELPKTIVAEFIDEGRLSILGVPGEKLEQLLREMYDSKVFDSIQSAGLQGNGPSLQKPAKQAPEQTIRKRTERLRSILRKAKPKTENRVYKK